MNAFLRNILILLLLINVALVGYYYLLPTVKNVLQPQQSMIDTTQKMQIKVVSDVNNKKIDVIKSDFLSKKINEAKFWDFRAVYIIEKPHRITANSLTIHFTDVPQSTKTYVTDPATKQIGYALGEQYDPDGNFNIYVYIHPEIIKKESNLELAQDFSYYALAGVYFMTHPQEFKEANLKKGADNEFQYIKPLFDLADKTFVQIQ